MHISRQVLSNPESIPNLFPNGSFLGKKVMCERRKLYLYMKAMLIKSYPAFLLLEITSVQGSVFIKKEDLLSYQSFKKYFSELSKEKMEAS